jgi:hypothetical protein
MWFIPFLEIIGIPLVALGILTFIVGATDKTPISNEKAVDIGMDLGILAIGACGGIFANPTLVQHFGPGVTIYAIIVTLLSVLSVAILAYIRRWQKSPVSDAVAARNVFLGLIPVGLIVSLLVIGLYN